MRCGQFVTLLPVCRQTAQRLVFAPKSILFRPEGQVQIEQEISPALSIEVC